jgi:uncharacterized membrane protein YqjE
MTEPAGRAREPAINSFLESVGELLVTAVEMAHTRLELAFLELQQGLALVFLYWDTHRVLVATLIMLVFLLLAAIAATVVRGQLRAQRALFATTMTELNKDRAVIKVPP